MKYNGIAFNKAYWKGKTEEQFLQQEAHHGLTEDQLREAFAKLNPPAANKTVEVQPVKTEEASPKAQGKSDPKTSKTV